MIYFERNDTRSFCDYGSLLHDYGLSDDSARDNKSPKGLEGKLPDCRIRDQKDKGEMIMLIIGKDLCPKCGEVLKVNQDMRTRHIVCVTCGTDSRVLGKMHEEKLKSGNAICNFGDGFMAANIPELLSKNSRLQSENASLQSENKILREIIDQKNKESENILTAIKNMKAELARCGIV